MGFFLVLLRRAVQLAVLTLLVTLATFILSSWIPGDFYTARGLDPTIRQEAVDQLRRSYGLDQPIPVQYWRWLVNLVRMDLGYSLFYQRPVVEVVIDALAKTLWMGIPALILGVLGGIFWGVVHALHQKRLLAHLLDTLSTLFLSLPTLVLGLTALLIASRTQWFPLGGMSDQGLANPGIGPWLLDRVHHLALPVICLSLPIMATVERIQYAATRASADDLYFRSARARGLSRRRVLLQYLLRPSLTPIIAISGPLFGGILSGSLVLELIFSWPGLGQITYNALFNNDLFLLVGCIVASALLLVVGNLSSDLLLLAVDPRTRAADRGLRT